MRRRFDSELHSTSTMTETDQALRELATGMLSGPADQTWEVFDRAWPALLKLLATFQRSLGVRPDLRDDCGQAVLTRVWKARMNYRGTSAPELAGWIYTICRREHVRLLEADAKRPRSTSELATTSGDDSMSVTDALEATPRQSTDSIVDARDELNALEDCMSRLDGQLREVTELLYSADAPTERDVAKLMGCSKSQINVLRQKALHALSACMQAKGCTS
jgi:RNA polymerase sigma factor (sigma-70 family)